MRVVVLLDTDRDGDVRMVVRPIVDHAGEGLDGGDGGIFLGLLGGGVLHGLGSVGGGLQDLEAIASVDVSGRRRRRICHGPRPRSRCRGLVQRKLDWLIVGEAPVRMADA